MNILGAGMAGCMMGAMHPVARLYEKQDSLPENHQAVLRHRDNRIGETLGIPFKKVRVHKACWFDNREVSVTPRLANWYAKKVTRTLHGDRSIWNLDPVDRYVAPSTFHEQVEGMCAGRIEYDYPVETIGDIPDGEEGQLRGPPEPLGRFIIPVISTLPINVLAAILGQDAPGNCSHESVFVNRYHVDACDLHQTVYFPEPGLGLYRATLTGAHLILESVLRVCPVDVIVATEALGLETSELTAVTTDHEQEYGKIVPIDARERRQFIFNATAQHNVYSLGRYATWRNILLDDVLNDILVIRRLLGADIYEHSLR